MVSTADHTHAPATLIAITLGKHVYCEKPLTHSVEEARVIARLAARHKVATQMGTQVHASENYRRVVEIIRSGAIGPVTEVYNWCNKGWSDGRFTAWDKPVPANLDWDLWLGPGFKRPYSPGIHPANWRRFWEYGSGTFGDMACHVMDLPFWALELRYPTAVSAEGPPVHPDGTPAWVKARYQFPARGQQPAVKFCWSDGGAHEDLVKHRHGPGRQALEQLGLGRAVRRQPGNAGRRLRQVRAVSARQVRRFHAAPGDDRPLRRALERMGRGLQTRHADHLQF